MSVVDAHDAIHANVSHLPHGQTCGYTTGSPAIKWTAADWKLHPMGVRICQDSGTDHTADCLDVERGAATNAQAPIWFKAAAKAYQSAARPGQRSPAVYCSASNVTPLVNAFIASGIKSGCGLWVANWNLSRDQAAAEVEKAGGPFPVIGVQYSNGPLYDFDVFDSGWLARQSAPPSSGPHRHVTSGGDTIASLAASRGMTPQAWLGLQDKLGADVTALASGHLADGITWLSVNA